MDIVELSPEDLDPAMVAQAVEVENAVRAVDSPWVHPSTVRGMEGRIRFGWDLEPGRYFLGLDRGRAVAGGVLSTSEWDNRDLAWLELAVAPTMRRQGFGREMYALLVHETRAMGRSKVGADAWDGTAGEAFANLLGLERKSQAINRRQHLAELSFEKLERLHSEAAAAAAAYELVRITGRTPEALLGPVAEMSAAINDAPLDDLDLEDEVYSTERVRDYETATLARGHRLYRLLARHPETGALAGHTVVAVEEERPEIGHQHDTSVTRAHRGHRLGLLLKSGMNLWLREAEPQLATVDTWNAESNDHMIAVNEELGYRWMGRAVQLQRTL
jgi:GNAT superfamily N-acetyltransferase